MPSWKPWDRVTLADLHSICSRNTDVWIAKGRKGDPCQACKIWGLCCMICDEDPRDWELYEGDVIDIE